MPGFTLAFVEAPLRQPWWRLFARQPHPPESADIVEMIDYIFAWYMWDGHQLQACLFRLGLCPEPLPEEGDDTSRRGDWFAAGVLPSRFAAMLDEWLLFMNGRRLWLRVDGIAAIAENVADLEHLLRQASQRRLDRRMSS